VRKAVYTAFVAFWAAVATIALIDRLQDRPAGAMDASPQTAYSLADISRHGEPGDCWMAIDGAVYDLSDYLPRHPTAIEVVADWCGSDASRAMHTKGKLGSDHSDAAWRRLERYRIGTLAD
jgi:cytochrome b involved in lipid metabolism